MQKRHLLRLLTLACVLTAAFAVIALRLQNSVSAGVVPTLMLLPTLDPLAQEIASVPTATLTTNSMISTATSLSVTNTEVASTSTSTHTQTPTQTVTSTITNTATRQPTDLPLPTDEIQLATPPEAPVANQVIITFAPDTSTAEQTAYIESIGGEVSQTIDTLNSVVVQLPPAVTDQTLPDSDIVTASEPDYYMSALLNAPTSDPYYAQQWALSAINVPAAWLTLTENMPTITIAVIDSGVCLNHPDLQGKVLPGWDYIDSDAMPQDDYGHGCGVAGIIAANADNSIGIAGIAPNARILPFRVLDANGIGPYSNVAAAIIRATDEGAQIINLSLGGSATSTVLENAVNYAVSRGVIVVAAAGNRGLPGVLYPAAYPAVIAVGSVDSNLQPSSFNSTGPEIDTYAPGSAIYSLRNNDDYVMMSGTSFAAPQVAGVAALELGRGLTLNINGGIITTSDTPQLAFPTAMAPIDENMLTDAERTLLEQVRQNGQIEVIVGLNIPFRYAGEASPQELQVQDVSVQQARLSLLQSLTDSNVEVLSDTTSWSIPFVALRIDEDGLLALLASQAVLSIEENRRNGLLLDSSVPVIRAPQVWSMGYTGTGQTVAVLDTGVERTHAFLGNRVVAEACYSGNGNSSNSFCPNGQTTQSGTGSASPQRCLTLGLEGCEHGTHVAGIASGYSGTFSGVAPNSSIIGVQVFSNDPGYTEPGAWDSDIISGLNYIYNLRGTYSIAAVNLSLGSGAFSSHCDTYSPSMTTSFQLLRSVRIAPVVATGNNGYSSYISYPACISYAVSVGATTDADGVAYFSNDAPNIQELFAPGVSIRSSVPLNSETDLFDGVADSFGTMSGTSMAAPHVAGAFAVYRQFAPNTSVDTIVSVFRSTGPSINVAGGSIPRLNLEAAVQYAISMTPTASRTPTVLPTATAIRGTLPPSRIGIYNPPDGRWYLNTPNGAPTVYQFGGFGTPVVGDWNGDGVDTLGIYNPPDGRWYLTNLNGQPATVYQFGGFGTPVVGDWDGNGTDTLGIYNPSDGRWYLTNLNGQPATVYQFGGFGTPVVGDWDGNGTDTLGIYNPPDGRWYLTNLNSSPLNSFQYGGFGTPVVGDWNGDGIDSIGIYNPPDGKWYLKNTNSNGAPNYLLQYGGFGTPVVGAWTMSIALGLNVQAFAENWDEIVADGIATEEALPTPTLSPTASPTASTTLTQTLTLNPTLTMTMTTSQTATVSLTPTVEMTVSATVTPFATATVIELSLTPSPEASTEAPTAVPTIEVTSTPTAPLTPSSTVPASETATDAPTVPPTVTETPVPFATVSLPTADILPTATPEAVPTTPS